MKRVLSALILVLVLLPLMLLMRWGGEAKGPWSEVRDGVQARLVSPRYPWRADEAVEIRVRFRNRSPDARDIPSLPVSLRVRMEDAPAVEETIALPAVVLPVYGTVDAVLRKAPLPGAKPGACEVEAALPQLGLPALDLRLVKPR